jgi:hypothetical protein
MICVYMLRVEILTVEILSVDMLSAVILSVIVLLCSQESELFYGRHKFFSVKSYTNLFFRY